MLWKRLNPRYRKLLKSGQQGEAVVVEAKADRARDDIRTDSTGIFGWNATIRVKYDDGSTADFDRYIEAGSADTVTPGMVLPVRFDPRNRSRVEIDTAAIRAQSDLGEREIEPLSTDPYQPDT
jgi:hypothetical protein